MSELEQLAAEVLADFDEPELGDVGAPVFAPFPYFEGKRRVAPLVWQRFGDVPNYVEAWKASGGYGNRNPDNTNNERERIWFSPGCLGGAQGSLLLF